MKIFKIFKQLNICFFNKNLGSSQRYTGFTIAEVLIVLGIIGIVAQMTIPPLVNNYQKTQYVTGLKKAYMTLEQGFASYLADEGVESLGSTPLFDGVTDNTDPARQEIIDSFAKKYFNVIRSCKYGDSSCEVAGRYLKNSNSITEFGRNNYNFFMADGIGFSLIFLKTCTPDYSKLGPIKAQCIRAFVDVNGAKPPNKVGRDHYYFLLVNYNGKVYPSGGVAAAQYFIGDTWASSTSYWKSNPVGCGIQGAPLPSTVSGYQCLGRIMEEGWQMNY